MSERQNQSHYFPKNYDEARRRFLKSAQRIREKCSDVALDSFRVPSRRDDQLFVDSLEIPARKKRETLLILTSGVHGSEGFAGSAIQLMFLEELAEKIPFENVGLRMVHALNPFGFKYHRRSTENNVNLNRNFGADRELFQTTNTEYDCLADLLDPARPATNRLGSFAEAFAIVARAILTKGFTGDSLNRAIAHGQFRYPRGMEYGGSTWEPQIEDFIAQLKRAMKGYENVVVFDLHTGLGDRYELHLIPVDEPKSRDEVLMKRLFRPEEEGHLYKITNPDAEGFYETAGDLNSLPPKIAAAGQRTLTLTFEFGTLGNSSWAKIDSLSRILNETRGFHSGYRNQAIRAESERRFLELFAPSESKWRENVITRSRETLSRVLSRLP